MKKRRCVSLFLAVLMAFSMVLTSLPTQQVLADEADNESSFTETDDGTDATDSTSSDLELVDSVSHVTVHDPSVVKGYVKESVTTMNSSVEIVGEADETYTKAVYFIFGSHLAWAYSWDMVNWTIFYNNINSDYSTLFANEFDWANNGDSAYAESGNMWAPDVIWNEAMGKWCMYMSINGCSWNSCICMLTADSLIGDWTYVGPVVYSGFTASGTYSYTQTDYAKVTGDSSLPSRYIMNYSYNCSDGNTTCEATTWNTSYGAHAIDPCVTYDADGNLWMSYGSWSGGIYMIELDEDTGLRDYTVIYDTVTNVSDAYMGYQIAGGKFVSGEASYIEYIDGYYYLFVTYGGLTASGGYNMRLYRSTTINGGYVDEDGTSAIYSSYEFNYSNSTGLRVMSYYKWSFQDTAQVAQGHNSVYYDQDSGKIYLVYHRRTNDGTEGHEVRVHQMFLNEDGWLVTAPFEYTGETISDTGYSDTEIVGTYEMIIQYKSVDYENLGYSGSKFITLKSDGTVSGSLNGTWDSEDDSYYITLELNGETYKGVLLEQQIEGEYASAMTFTVLGTDNETYLWGYKCDDLTDTTVTVGSTNWWGVTSTLAWDNLSGFFMYTAPEGDFTMDWTFYNQGSSSAWYYNYILYVTTDIGLDKTSVSYGGTDWSLRADAYSNTTFSGSDVEITYDWEWDDFSTIMNGAKIQTTLVRIDTTMTYSAIINGSDGNTYHYTAIVGNAPEEAVAVYLGGENCYLEIDADSISVETGHNYTIASSEPTCTEMGYTYLTCKDCGKVIVTDYVDALGHTWVLTETVSPSSQSKGYSIYTCSECGETYEDNYTAIPMEDFCTATVSGSYSYTGSAIKATVTVKDGDKTLTAGTDYTISYSNNVNASTSSSLASYTITGKGDYTGTITGTFTIEKASQTVTASASSSTVAVGSTITVTGSGTGTITYSSSNESVATVSSSGVVTGKSTGTAVITVNASGNSNYSAGSKTITVTVTKGSQTVTASIASSSIEAGKTTTVTASGIGTLTYSSSNTEVATVSSSGVVTGVGAGTATITVTAVGNSNYNLASKTVTVTVGLSATTISSVKQSKTAVTVKWSKVTGAKGYYVYRSTSSSSGYSLAGTVTDGDTVSYKDTASKTNGTTYYYKVVAYSGSTVSADSSVKSIKYMKAAVSSLTNTSKGITVKWKKVSGATGYYIYRKTSSGSYKKVKTITKGSTVSWTDTSVKSKNGTTYTYYVQPYNSTSKGAYSTKKTVRLTAVSISSLKNSSSKTLTVKYKKNSKATGYQIQYSTSKTFAKGNKTVTVTKASTLSQKLTKLTKSKTYYVRVRAYKKVGSTKYYSAWSSKKSKKVSK